MLSHPFPGSDLLFSLLLLPPEWFLIPMGTRGTSSWGNYDSDLALLHFSLCGGVGPGSGGMSVY